ncbi:MAG: MATE family efflux transporter [Tissierellia bacterium]|nr:MATE family efflux transporter [Tissierellia bacterium]
MNPLIKRFFHYIIPSIAAMWVYSLYTMVDGYFIANYVGPVEFSAINIAMPFVNTIFALAIIFAVGTSTLVGISLGRGEKKKANEIFSTTLCILSLAALGITLFFRFRLDQIVTLLGATPHTKVFVHDYILIVLHFCIFFMVSYNFEVIIKVDGFPVLATIGVIASALTNVLLDYIFVAKFHWGVKGAAWATGIAQVFSTILFLYHFVFGKSQLQFTKNIKMGFLKQVFPIGTGDFIAEMSLGIIVFLFNHFLPRTLGEESLISYTVVSYVSLLITMTMTGLVQGVQPLISLYLGKREIPTVKKLLSYGFMGIGIASLLSIFLVNVWTKEITGLFLSDVTPKILHMTYQALRRYSTAYLFLGFNLLCGGYFAAVGKARPSIFINVSRGFVFIVLALTFTSKVLAPPMIWYSALISEAITFVLGMSLIYINFKYLVKN